MFILCLSPISSMFFKLNQNSVHNRLQRMYVKSRNIIYCEIICILFCSNGWVHAKIMSRLRWLAYLSQTIKCHEQSWFNSYNWDTIRSRLGITTNITLAPNHPNPSIAFKTLIPSTMVKENIFNWMNSILNVDMHRAQHWVRHRIGARHYLLLWFKSIIFYAIPRT